MTPNALTVASFLHEAEFAGRPVSRQSDDVKVLSSCRKGRTILRGKTRTKEANLLSPLLHESRTEPVCKNKGAHSNTLAGTWVGGATWTSQGSNTKRQQRRLTTPKKSRQCAERRTHSSPWRAASSPPGPCLACCPPRSSCGTSHTQAHKAERHTTVTGEPSRVVGLLQGSHMCSQRTS